MLNNIVLASSKLIAVLNNPSNPAPGFFIDPSVTGSDFASILTFILTILMALIGFVSTIYLVVGAYYYIANLGNEEVIKKGKKMMLNAVIGLVIATLSYAILAVILNLAKGTF